MHSKQLAERQGSVFGGGLERFEQECKPLKPVPERGNLRLSGRSFGLPGRCRNGRCNALKPRVRAQPAKDPFFEIADTAAKAGLRLSARGEWMFEQRQEPKG